MKSMNELQYLTRFKIFHQLRSINTRQVLLLKHKYILPLIYKYVLNKIVGYLLMEKVLKYIGFTCN